MKRFLSLRLVVPATLTMLVTGCDAIFVGDERFVGAIGYPDHVAIVLPDSVRTGLAFTVSVRTLGADGCWRKDRTEVTLSGLAATVTPHDVRTRQRGIDCTTMPVEITHTATLTVHQPGALQVRVRGRDGTVVRSVIVE